MFLYLRHKATYFIYFKKICLMCPASAACSLLLDRCIQNNIPAPLIILIIQTHQPFIRYKELVAMLTPLEAITTGPWGIWEFSYGDKLSLTGIILTSLTPPPQKNAPNSSQHVLACVLHVDRSSYHSSVCARQTDCEVWVSLLSSSIEACFPLLGRKVSYLFSLRTGWIWEGKDGRKHLE